VDVLFGGYGGCAEVGNWGGWGWGIWDASGMSGHHVVDKRGLTKSLELAISIKWRKPYVGR
jgi:hypothetical protein